MIHHQKPECLVKKCGLLHSGSRSQQRVKMFVQISSKPPNILFANLILLCVILSRSVVQKDCLLFSRSRSLQDLIWSKYDNFYCIFWTADPFPTKLGLVVHYQRPECFMEKVDRCIKVKVTANFKMSVNVCLYDIFRIAWTFLLRNLVWWCIIMSQIVFQKDCFAVFKIRVTVKDNIIKLWLFNMFSELLILLQLNLV